MPVVEIVDDNIPANTQNRDEMSGKRAAQIDPECRGASIRLLAVASAVDLTHALWVGSRNPLEVSEVPVSATPNQIIDPDNLIVSGVIGLPNQYIRLYVSETAGVATNDYRARVVVSEL